MTEIRTKPFMPPSRDALAADWRRGFIRSATIRTLSQLRKTSASEIEREMRAPSAPLKAADFPGGSVAKLMLLAPKSAAAQLFPLATTVDLAGISSFSFPLPTNFSNATFVPEGGVIPVKQGAFSGFGIGPVRKLALLAALSGELESASGDIATTIIGHTLEVAVGRGLDAVLFSANAATADAPAGLLFGVTPITPVAGGGFTAMSGDLRALIASISAAGIDTANVVFVSSPSQALAIQLAAGPHFAHRIIEANSLASGVVVAVAVSALVVAGDGAAPVVDISKQAVLHYGDPPAPISIVGSPDNIMSAPTQSTFQSDTQALRCTSRITWAAAPKSVAVINNATW